MFQILIVDDPGTRELVGEELAYDGHTVAITGDGDAAGEFIQISKPDLVILDPYLEGRYRWDLLREMKQKYPYLPILIVTDYSTTRRDPHVALADAYFNKDSCPPGNYVEELKRKVNQTLLSTPLAGKGVLKVHGQGSSANGNSYSSGSR